MISEAPKNFQDKLALRPMRERGRHCRYRWFGMFKTEWPRLVIQQRQPDSHRPENLFVE
jgi:hypothetical protein